MADEPKVRVTARTPDGVQIAAWDTHESGEHVPVPAEDTWGPDKPPYVCKACGHDVFKRIGEAVAHQIGGVWKDSEDAPADEVEPEWDDDGSGIQPDEWSHTDRYVCAGCDATSRVLDDLVKLR